MIEKAMAFRYYFTVLLLFVCYTVVLSQRVAPDRNPTTPVLVDKRPGYSPLYQSSDEGKRRKGNYIIKLKETTRHDDLGRILAKLTDRDQDPDDDAAVQGLSGYSAVGLGVMAALNHKALDTVRQDSSVKYVEEDQIVTISAEPWHTSRVDQRKLPINKKFCPPNDGEGVDIYVLDTGINYCHEDFCLNRSKYAGYSPVVSPTNLNTDGRDCHGHGTHVAALAVGGIHGIARKARVFSLPVLDCQGSGSNINIILALNHVAMRAEANPNRRTIISMSLTAPLSLAVNEAVQSVTEAAQLQAGILVVAAAGNFKSDACRFSPASSSHAVTVGGSAKNDFLYWGATFFGTNYGRCVDIFAPGADVKSASHQSCNGESVMSGTSMATPIVAGAAAIIWTADMSLTPAQVKDKLIDQSTKDVLNLQQLFPSARSVTPNRLVFTGKAKCRKSSDACKAPTPAPSCGRPWDCAPTTLMTSIRISNLKKLINQQRSQNMIPIYISPYTKEDVTYFAMIFKQVDNFRSYRVEFDLDTNAMTRKVKALNSKKYFAIFVTSYLRDGKLYHIVVLCRSGGSPNVELFLDQTASSYNANSNSVGGLDIASLAVTRNGQNELRYSTLYKETGGENVVFCGMTFRALRKRINKQRNRGFTLKHIDTYVANDSTRYCAIFTNEKIGDCEYDFVHSYSETDIADIAESQRNDGFHIVAVAVHSQRSFPLFMAVFKK